MKKWHKSPESKKKSYLEGKRRDKKTMLELMTVLSIGICLSVGVLLVAIWQVKFSKKMCYFWSKNIKISLLKLAIIPRFWPYTILYLVNILADIEIKIMVIWFWLKIMVFWEKCCFAFQYDLVWFVVWTVENLIINFTDL